MRVSSFYSCLSFSFNEEQFEFVAPVSSSVSWKEMVRKFKLFNGPHKARARKRKKNS